MEKMTTEQRLTRLAELQSLEDNQTHRLLLTRLQALQNSKRVEQRQAAFSNDTAKTLGCEWAIWGLEQYMTIIAHMRKELNERPEMTR